MKETRSFVSNSGVREIGVEDAVPEGFRQFSNSDFIFNSIRMVDAMDGAPRVRARGSGGRLAIGADAGGRVGGGGIVDLAHRAASLPGLAQWNPGGTAKGELTPRESGN